MEATIGVERPMGGVLEKGPVFDELVREQGDRALGLAFHLTGGDREAARDVVQEALLKAYDGLDRFRGESKITTWFLRIVLNTASKYRRRRWVRDRWARLWGGDGSGGRGPPAEVESQPASEADPALRRRIAEAMNHLSAGQREAFSLVHLEGLTVVEAAAVMNRAPGTVKSHLHRALMVLRRELADLKEG